MRTPADHLTNLSLPKVARFAHFLVTHHLEDFARAFQTAFAAEGVNLSAHLSTDNKELSEPAYIDYASQYLQLLIDDNAGKQIEKSLQAIFPAMEETLQELQARTGAMFQLGYIRKKVFKAFLPLYTTDVTEAIAIVGEIDHYSMVFEKAANEIYLQHIAQLLQLREEQLLEAQQLSGT